MWVITGTWRLSGPKLKPVPDKGVAKRTGVYPSKERSRALLPGHSYKLGRSLDNLLACPFAHVSDHHATLVVGPHSVEDATDLSSQPTLTLQPLPAAPKSSRDGEPALDKSHPVFLTTAGGDDTCVPPRDAPRDDTPCALGHGDVLRFKVDEAQYRVEWKPVVLKLEAASKIRAAIVEKAAPLGLKVVKKDSDVDGTHLVLDTGKALAKVPVLVALADQTPIVSPAFVDALTAAAELLAAPAEAREKRERWSALEEDVVKNWPQEAAFEPEIDVAGSRGSFARDPARQSLLKGLTVLGLRIKDSASVKAAQRIVERCGGTFVQVDLTMLPDPKRASLHKLLVDRKAAADKEYPAYLRQANKTIPSAARSSGLVLIMTSAAFTTDLASVNDLGWDDVAGASLGLELATMKALGLALLECDPSPLLKASRRSGATGDGAQSLPSQVSASITSSRGQPEALVSPGVDSSAPLTGASSPEKGLEDYTTFDLGDDDVGEISMFDLDAMESPPSSPPRPLPQVDESLPPSPPSRAPISTNPFENWSVQIPPPTARRRRTAATESQSKAAGASVPASAQSSLGAGKLSSIDDSYEEPAPQSERAKSLYESIRAKSRGGGIPQASGSSSLAGGAIEEEGGDDDGEAFVEGQRKRRRAAQAAEEEQRKRARLEAGAMEGVEAAGSQAGQSSREASALVESAPAAAKGAMLPPPVPEKGKRKAVDKQDTDFLRAPVKRKRKNQAEDPLDVDFNNLKIAKLPGRRVATEEEVPEIDGVTPRLVSVFIPLFEKKHPTASPAAADGVVDFKKFRSNKGGAQAPGPRRRGPAVAMAPVDDGSSRSRAKRDSQVQEDEDMKPLVDDDGSQAARSASVSQRTTQSAGTSTAGSRRKKLIWADDSDDESLVRTARGAKSTKKEAAAPNSDDEAARARTTATLEESDEEEAPAPRPKARTGRRKLIQAGDSDEDGFKGWGTNARAKRR